MATIQSIIDRVTDVTKDRDHVRWTLPEIARWLNNAQDSIATLTPRASSRYLSLTLQEGSRQDLRTIDANTRWLRLYDLLCNMRDDRPTGTTIRQVSRPALDFSARAWRGQPPTAIAVKEFATDERDPYSFDVYPPVVAGVKVYALAAVKPESSMKLNSEGTGLVDPDEVFPLADGYDIPAVDYILFRCFSKDTNDQSYASRATAHLQAFQLALNAETNDARVQ